MTINTYPEYLHTATRDEPLNNKKIISTSNSGHSKPHQIPHQLECTYSKPHRVPLQLEYITAPYTLVWIALYTVVETSGHCTALAPNF
eukprot:1395564-Amorphochlora_amoeboformis.AAC.1